MHLNMFAVCFGCCMALTAHAASPPRATFDAQHERFQGGLGRAKQLFLDGSTSASVVGVHEQLDGDKSDRADVAVTLKGGVFAPHHVAVGIAGTASIIDVVSPTVATSVGPFFGGLVPISQTASFLPTLAVLYNYTHLYAGDDTLTSHALALEADLNFVFQIAEHVGLTFGPFVQQSVYQRAIDATYNASTHQKGPWTTSYGLKFGVLGWL